MKVYFGDMHNHTTLSDGDGTPESCIEQARASLDFFAFTDHLQYPDLPYTPGSSTQVGAGDEEWREGVPQLARRWSDVQRLIKENNRPGEFATFLGYEWSSDRWGDRNVYYLEDDQPLRYANSLAELYATVKDVEAMIIPHHTAYSLHHRGIDWQDFDSFRAPVVEIFSFHGSSETDEGPYDFTGNPMGPRTRSGTAQRGLELGNIFGFIASTDNHHTFPGEYGMGLAAIYADELSRKSLWEGLHKRRTYAVTGDRIHLEFQINNKMMGNIVPITPRAPQQMSVRVAGWDCLDAVELLKNGKVLRRWSNLKDQAVNDSRLFKVWLHWGYHSRPSERKWDISVEASDGTITSYNPAFIAPTYSKAQLDGPRRLTIDSRTQLTGKFGGAFQRLAFEVVATPGTTISVLEAGKRVLSGNVDELLKTTMTAIPFGPYSGAISLGRAIAEPHFAASLEYEESPDGIKPGDYYYVRAFQQNGQACWSSPIWMSAGSA